MRKLHALLFGLFVAVGARANAQGIGNAPLKLLHTTPLPGFHGDLDHFAVDLKGGRIFVTAEAHKTVEVFDLKSGDRVHSIIGFGKPHSMAFLPEKNRLIVADGGDGTVKVVNGQSYEIIDSITLWPGVDSSQYNPATQEFYVANRGPNPSADTHMISVIDTKTFKHDGDLILPGSRSMAMVFDRAGKIMYVNLMDEVGVVDVLARRLIARWPVPNAHSQKANGSIALDEAKHRLFVATRYPPTFFVYDTETGRVVASLPCVGANDDMTFDAKRKRIYITGDGATSVFEQRDTDHYEHLTDVPTAYLAKTSVYVPELNRLYIAVSGGNKSDAALALRMYQVEP
jgi:DNA-binding beta-propeller fold protein YncE